MRNHVLDAAKIIAAYAVIFLHVHYPGISGDMINILMRFAVPFFFLVSGYFCYSNKGNINQKMPAKIRHILKLTVFSLIFYIVWGFLYRMSKGEDAIQWVGDLVQKQYIREFILYNSTSPVKYHLWFLVALLYCYLIFWTVEHFHLHAAAGILIPVLLAGNFYLGEGAALRGTAFRAMYYRNWIFTGLPFFMLGYWIHCRENVIRKHMNRKVLYLGVICGIFLTIMEYFRVGKQELFIGTVISVCCLFIWCVLSQDIMLPGWLTETGRNDAFLIYLLHPAVWEAWKDTVGVMGVTGEFWFVWSAPVLVCIFTTILAESVRFAVHFWKNVI